MSLPHQDWDTAVIHTTKTKKDLIKSGEFQTVRKNTENKQKTNVLNKTASHDFDPENTQKPIVSNHDLGLAIQQARCAKTKTQSELDKACNFPKNTTKEYENGTAIILHEQLNKMNNVLETKLPRPNKK